MIAPVLPPLSGGPLRIEDVAPADGLRAEQPIRQEREEETSIMLSLERLARYDRERDGTLYDLSPLHRARLSRAHEGREVDELWRERIGEANRRRERDPIFRLGKAARDRRRSEKQRGRAVSEESREKMAAAKRGKSRPLSEECKRKISERAKSRVYSEEARERFRAAALRRAALARERRKSLELSSSLRPRRAVEQPESLSESCLASREPARSSQELPAGCLEEPSRRQEQPGRPENTLQEGGLEHRRLPQKTFSVSRRNRVDPSGASVHVGSGRKQRPRPESLRPGRPSRRGSALENARDFWAVSDRPVRADLRGRVCRGLC